MAAKSTIRKVLSKKIRFEILKRDGFQCQYCGSSAPDVVLNVDHINPVSNGGDNNVLNLITSCFACNAGKSDRKISDSDVLKKSLNQARETSEKLTQLKMMSDWHKEISKIDDKKFETVIEHINIHLNKYQKKINAEKASQEISLLIKNYSMDIILKGIDGSAKSYLLRNTDIEKFISKIEKVCYWIKEEIDNPELTKYRKIAFSARKKWGGSHVDEIMAIMQYYHEFKNIPISALYKNVFECSSIYGFKSKIEALCV